jgi:hypothetical protein
MSKIVPFWVDDPVSWDALYITGKSAPVIVDNLDVTRGFRVDKKEGPGVNGGVVTFKGKKLPDVKIRLKLWTRNHLLKLSQLIFSIYEKKTAGEAFDIQHPILAVNGIGALTIETTRGPTKPNDDGISFFEMDCNVHSPPPPKPVADATKTPTAKGAGGVSLSSTDHEKLLRQLEADRAVLAFAGKSTSQVDERIYNLKQRDKSQAMSSGGTTPKPAAPPFPLPPGFSS